MPHGGAGDFISETVYYVGDPVNPLVFTLPQPLTMRLRSQRTPIRGVAIDAEFCPGVVTVYGGTSGAQGPGYTVQPGTARAFGIEGTAAIYVTFGPATKAGYARITAYPGPIEAYGIGTGSAAIAAFATKVEGRLHHVITLLEQILAKLP
jgi:hypothetical protein